MASAHLSLQAIQKIFRPKRGSPVMAIQEVDLEIGENEFVSIIGPSGCGKSTLLRLAAGLEQPDAGRVLVNGRPIEGASPDRGMVFQQPALFPWLTVQQNIAFALQKSGFSEVEKSERIQSYLQIIGMESFANAYPNQLSGGMAQRVAIARALAPNPQILLMDEPFGALDAQTRLFMQELLLQVWERQRTTVLFVTHDVEEAVLLSDRVVAMSRRPGVVKAEVQVPFSRPRQALELETDPHFLEIRYELLRLVREEARKAFSMN